MGLGEERELRERERDPPRLDTQKELTQESRMRLLLQRDARGGTLAFYFC
jgi:hypothetical protein